MSRLDQDRGDAPPLPPASWNVPDAVTHGPARLGLMSALRQQGDEVKRNAPRTGGGTHHHTKRPITRGSASRYVPFDLTTNGPKSTTSAPPPPRVLRVNQPRHRDVLFDCATCAAALSKAYPFKFRNENKQVVQSMAYPDAAQESGQIALVRCDTSGFGTLKWPCTGASSITIERGFFSYTARSKSREAWYPNFAHDHLFVAWNTNLLAQDELQALEFPILVSLRLALLQEAPTHARTRGRDGKATPVLIRGAQRRCAIDTSSSPSIYGNAFQSAGEELIRSRVTLPVGAGSLGNIYAMEAPARGYGQYKYEQIRDILMTAYSAFGAIVRLSGSSSEKISGGSSSGAEGGRSGRHVDDRQVELHIGFWGCGAYGGNRVLMILLQLLAARLAGVPHVVVNAPVGFESDAESAIELLQMAPLHEFNGLLVWICEQQFKWGQSDGN